MVIMAQAEWRWRELNPRPKSSSQSHYKLSQSLSLAFPDPSDRIGNAQPCWLAPLGRLLPAWQPPHPNLVSPSIRPLGENVCGRRSARLRTLRRIRSWLTPQPEEPRGWCECSHLHGARFLRGQAPLLATLSQPSPSKPIIPMETADTGDFGLVNSIIARLASRFNPGFPMSAVQIGGNSSLRATVGSEAMSPEAAIAPAPLWSRGSLDTHGVCDHLEVTTGPVKRSCSGPAQWAHSEAGV